MTWRGREGPQAPPGRVWAKPPHRFVIPDIGAALKIAARQGIYAYDAYMIQCCIETRSPLLSLDRRLNAATEREGVTVRREG